MHIFFFNFIIDLISGGIKVGFITFEMSLSVKDLDLKPRVSELYGFIARELGINITQVLWSWFYYNNAIEEAKICSNLFKYISPLPNFRF